MIFDADAYAEGICDANAGSAIEVFVDVIDLLIDEGGVFDDAIQYRRSDDGDEDAELDNERADAYRRAWDQFIELRKAIVQREEDNEESTVFGDNDEEGPHTVSPVGNGWAIFDNEGETVKDDDDNELLFSCEEDAQNAADELNTGN